MPRPFLLFSLSINKRWLIFAIKFTVCVGGLLIVAGEMKWMGIIRSSVCVSWNWVSKWQNIYINTIALVVLCCSGLSCLWSVSEFEWIRLLFVAVEIETRFRTMGIFFCLINERRKLNKKLGILSVQKLNKSILGIASFGLVGGLFFIDCYWVNICFQLRSR